MSRQTLKALGSEKSGLVYGVDGRRPGDRSPKGSAHVIAVFSSGVAPRCGQRHLDRPASSGLTTNCVTLPPASRRGPQEVPSECTPMSWHLTPAGLAEGPRMLEIVRTLSSTRTASRGAWPRGGCLWISRLRGDGSRPKLFPWAFTLFDNLQLSNVIAPQQQLSSAASLLGLPVSASETVT